MTFFFYFSSRSIFCCFFFLLFSLINRYQTGETICFQTFPATYISFCFINIVISTITSTFSEYLEFTPFHSMKIYISTLGIIKNIVKTANARNAILLQCLLLSYQHEPLKEATVHNFLSFYHNDKWHINDLYLTFYCFLLYLFQFINFQIQ